LVSASVVALAACGHRGGALHALPPGAGASNGGGTTGAARKPRTINEAAYPNAVLADHPVAFYRLDDTGTTMADAGTNGLNGTYGSAVTHGAGSLVPNTIDPGTGFNGGAWSATKIATVAQSSTLQPANVSIEAWVSEKSINSAGFIDLVSYGSQSGQGYTLQLTTSNTLSLYLSTTGGSSYVAATTVLTPGSAYHVVATYDGANAKIYINGTLEGTSTGGTAISYAGIGTYGLSIGAGQNTGRQVFNGTLDDVSVFNAALTSTQVSAHYAAGQVVPDDPYAQAVMADTPVAYYRLDDAGAAMYDATNNRINGKYGSSITKRVSSLVANTSDTAATFPGGAWSANSIATVPQNTLLQPTAITIEAWLKETTANSGGYLDLVSYGPQSGQGYSMQISPSNTITVFLKTTGTPSSITLSGATVLTAGTVYHVAATYDGTYAKLYVNNYLDASVSTTGNIDYSGISTYGLALGATQSTSRPVFNGTLDEVAIYDHALADARIYAHYTTTSWSSNQGGPPHIQTWIYYDNAHNYSVSLLYLLRHVDWAESAGDGTLANGFRAAGGRHAAWYIDPGISYYCNSPFGPTSQNTPGSCALPSGPLGDSTLSSDDTAWLHGSQATTSSLPSCYAAPVGARLHTWGSTCGDTSNYFLWGEPLYPGSSHVQTAFASATTAVTNANTRDAFFMDDSSPHYSTDGYTFQFGATVKEYDTLGSSADSTYNRDVIALACKASRPVFYNGGSWNALDTVNGPTEKTDDSNFLKSPCTLGQALEGAFVSGGFRKSLNQHALGNTFIPAADQALLVQSLAKSPLILNYNACAYGSSGCTFDPVGDRIYGLAGIWLIYDPRYTIAWNGVTQDNDPHMADGDGNWDSMVAEYGIVPTQPYQTATGVDITTLQISNGHTSSGNPAGGPFRREFAQCYQDGASIGRCAVVLNAESPDYTSGGVESMPTLGHTYSSALVLNDLPADNGGTAAWTTTLPTTLQPMTAVILKQ
jgi:hypothetical protein